jgi:hypothetical protein
MLGGNGGGSPTSPLASMFSCLSAQGQALLRGSCYECWYSVYLWHPWPAFAHA